MPQKLIRDHIPTIAAANGDRLAVRTASPDELPALLAQKLLEEVAEVNTADAEDVLEELADVLEVLQAIAALHGHSPASIEEARAGKAAARGGFEHRLVMEIPTPAPRYLKGEARLDVAIDLKRRYEAGATIRILSEQTGRPESTICALLQHAGTRMRPSAAKRG